MGMTTFDRIDQGLTGVIKTGGFVLLDIRLACFFLRTSVLVLPVYSDYDVTDIV